MASNNIGQWPFKDWEEAFKTYFDLEDKFNVVFLISTHWCTSGYWVERGGLESIKQVEEEGYYYTTEKEVKELYARVKVGIEKAKKEGKISPGLIL